MTDTTVITTAAKLIAFRQELLAGGVPEDYANDMTRDAAARIIQAAGLTTYSV